jgi:hypothetical protein
VQDRVAVPARLTAKVKKPPARKAPVRTVARKPVHHKKPAKKPMTARQYKAYLKYVDKHFPERKGKQLKPRKWSPDEDVALCSARAVAEALRLCRGLVLTDADILSLYWSTARDPDEGQTVLEALSAAREMGLARTFTAAHSGAYLIPFAGPPTILGLDLPGGEPHAVTYDPRDGTWWSWGQPYKPADFADAVIEEAWAVS